MKSKDKMQFLNELVDEIQEKIYGRVDIVRDMMIETYKICISDRDVTFVIDLTDTLYEIETQQDKDKLVHDIMQQYRTYILGGYIV